MGRVHAMMEQNQDIMKTKTAERTKAATACLLPLRIKSILVVRENAQACA